MADNEEFLLDRTFGDTLVFLKLEEAAIVVVVDSAGEEIRFPSNDTHNSIIDEFNKWSKDSDDFFALELKKMLKKRLEEIAESLTARFGAPKDKALN